MNTFKKNTLMLFALFYAGFECTQTNMPLYDSNVLSENSREKRPEL